MFDEERLNKIIGDAKAGKKKEQEEDVTPRLKKKELNSFIKRNYHDI